MTSRRRGAAGPTEPAGSSNPDAIEIALQRSEEVSPPTGVQLGGSHVRALDRELDGRAASFDELAALKYWAARYGAEVVSRNGVRCMRGLLNDRHHSCQRHGFQWHLPDENLGGPLRDHPRLLRWSSGTYAVLSQTYNDPRRDAPHSRLPGMS